MRLNEMDEPYRNLQRGVATGDNPSRLINAKLRTGQINQEQIELLADLGHQDSREFIEGNEGTIKRVWPQEIDRLGEWANRIWEWPDQETVDNVIWSILELLTQKVYANVAEEESGLITFGDQLASEFEKIVDTIKTHDPEVIGYKLKKFARDNFYHINGSPNIGREPTAPRAVGLFIPKTIELISNPWPSPEVKRALWRMLDYNLAEPEEIRKIIIDGFTKSMGL